MILIPTAYCFVSFIIDAKELQKVVMALHFFDDILNLISKQLTDNQIFFFLSKIFSLFSIVKKR